jgi:hypothetical protein
MRGFREEVMAERLGQVLQAIRIPDGVLAQLEESLLSDKTHEETLRKRQAERVEQRLTQLRRRLEQAYVDRLDGKITEEFWEAKSSARPESSAAALFGHFLIQALGKKHLEQGLVRHIAFVGQLFQARDDRNG